MKITTTKQVSTTVEVELPLYRKSLAFVYKVYSETNCLSVCFANGLEEIAKRDVSLAFSSDRTTDITEQEFNTTYNEVFTILNDLN